VRESGRRERKVKNDISHNVAFWLGWLFPSINIKPQLLRRVLALASFYPSSTKAFSVDIQLFTSRRASLFWCYKV
jgi:hypothetical protein